MKKMILAVAVVLCAALSSCTDTERCYNVTAKISVAGVETTAKDIMYWGTRDDINTLKEDIKSTLEATGIDEDAIKITAIANGKSQDDCK